MRIERSVFKYVEHEMYNYDDTKRELELQRVQIIEGTAKPDVTVQSGLSDITASKAIRLTTNVFILQSEKTIKAINKSLKLLDDRHRLLFKFKYQNCMPWQEAMLEIGVTSDRTYFRLRRQLVVMVAQQLGLIHKK